MSSLKNIWIALLLSNQVANGTPNINQVPKNFSEWDKSEIIFWKIAAYHEYEDNLNFQNARNLFQKCIKLNPGNVEAYLEYFTFELIFAKNITERKNILSGKTENDNDNNKKKKIAIVSDINTEKVHLAENYKKECQLIEYTPDYSKILRVWEFKGCWVKSLNEGNFNHDSEEKRQVDVTIEYDRAYLIANNR